MGMYDPPTEVRSRSLRCAHTFDSVHSTRSDTSWYSARTSLPVFSFLIISVGKWPASSKSARVVVVVIGSGVVSMVLSHGVSAVSLYRATQASGEQCVQYLLHDNCFGTAIQLVLLSRLPTS